MRRGADAGEARVVGGRDEGDGRRFGQAASEHHLARALDELALTINRSESSYAGRQQRGNVLETAEARNFLDQIGLLDEVGTK